MKICIDPGHGGYDPGAVGPTGLKEKDVTLPVAMLLADILRAAGQEVILTRDSDNTPWDSDNDLWKRCQIANDYGADVFVSIHINSAANPAATGTETYCVAFGGEGEKIARSVQKELVAALGLPDRGIKAANFYVLKRTDMPAILTELAFINNSAEEYMMRTDDFLRRAAEAIAQGIGNLYGFAVKGKAPSSNAVTITCGGQTFSGMLIGDITYAPVRAVAEALGRSVGWDDATKTVTIS